MVERGMKTGEGWEITRFDSSYLTLRYLDQLQRIFIFDSTI